MHYTPPQDLSTGNVINVVTTDTVKNLTGAPNLEEFHLWFESMRYGTTNLMNYSIQARDTLFTYTQLDSAPFTRETNLVSRFTVAVTFQIPNDPFVITSAVLASKGKAFVRYGSKFSTPP